MRTRLSDEFVLAVKDQLRTMRFKIRRGARGAAPLAASAPAPVAVATDAVFSQVEAAAASFLPKDEVALYAFAFPQQASAYFALDPDEAAALSPKIYSALKALLARFGSDVFLVSEQAAHKACESVLKRQSRAIGVALDATLPAADRFDACVALCADLAVALISAQPVREMMSGAETRQSPRDPFLAPNEYCAFLIGLAIALCSRPDVEGVDPQVLLEAADMAVYARLAELAAALKKRNASAALAAEFRDLLRFLP